jgi:hypothetical protein
MSEETHAESNLPPGPYATLMPTTGCPESKYQGWRTGYIYLVWQSTVKVLTSVPMAKPGCKQVSENNNVGDIANKTAKWFYDITEDSWPETCSNLLGPVNRFSFKLNFCVKDGDEKSPNNETVDWPDGDYAIVAAGKCPQGTDVSKIFNLSF